MLLLVQKPTAPGDLYGRVLYGDNPIPGDPGTPRKEGSVCITKLCKENSYVTHPVRPKIRGYYGVNCFVCVRNGYCTYQTKESFLFHGPPYTRPLGVSPVLGVRDRSHRTTQETESNPGAPVSDRHIPYHVHRPFLSVSLDGLPVLSPLPIDPESAHPVPDRLGCLRCRRKPLGKTRLEGRLESQDSPTPTTRHLPPVPSTLRTDPLP